MYGPRFIGFLIKKSPIEIPEKRDGKSVFVATGMEWKRMRNVMNPTFSSSKMREVNYLIILFILINLIIKHQLAESINIKMY